MSDVVFGEFDGSGGVIGRGWVGHVGYLPSDGVCDAGSFRAPGRARAKQVGRTLRQQYMAARKGALGRKRLAGPKGDQMVRWTLRGAELGEYA